MSDGVPPAAMTLAVAALPGRAVITVVGRDAIPFLQRLLTAEVAAVGAGVGTRSLLLEGRGHVVADLDLWMSSDGVVAATEAPALEPTLVELNRRILRAEVVVHGARESTLAVLGPATRPALAALGIEVPAETRYAHRQTIRDGSALHVRRTVRLPHGVEIAAAGELLDDLRQSLVSGDPPATELGTADLMALRVELGIPAWGAELTGSEFPQELGLDDTVSFDKGCYLGQETVARIRYRGHVNRHLRGLRLDASVLAGAALRVQERTVGAVTSVAHSARFGDIALAWVQREHAVEGTRVRVDGTGSAVVAMLPFA